MYTIIRQLTIKVRSAGFFFRTTHTFQHFTSTERNPAGNRQEVSKQFPDIFFIDLERPFFRL